MLTRFAALLAASTALCAPAFADCTPNVDCVLRDNGTPGQVPAAALPNPGSALGGVKSGTAPTNQFMTGIDTGGGLTFGRPSFPTLSGFITPAQGAQAVNVLALGANPATSGTGAADQSTIINSAFSQTIPGSSGKPNVYLPSGSYHVTNPINVPPGQCLIGDGWSTIIDVDMDFSTSASGVVVVTPTSSPNDVKPCVSGLQIFFHLPADVVSTVGAASSGATTLTVSNPSTLAQLKVGDYVFNNTTPSSIPAGTGVAPTTITSISGSVITITPALAGNVTNTDQIHFNRARANFKPLGSCNTVPSATSHGYPCQYPWAIYDNGAQNMDVDKVFVSQAYNGVYIRGQTFHIGYLEVGAVNIGLDLDDCYNFPQIDDYVFWNFTLNGGGSSGTVSRAIDNVFYDGHTIAGNLGETDGVAIGKWQVWTGQTNFTSRFTWGNIDQMMLDGDFANLNVANCQFFQVAQMYSTKSGLSSGIPLNFAPSSSSCKATFSNVNMGSVAQYNNIKVSNGSLQILGGNIWNGITGTTTSEIYQTGGKLEISNTTLDCGGIAAGATYVQQTGGELKFQNNKFTCVPNAGGTVGLSATDNAANVVTGNVWNGLTFANPGGLGVYENGVTAYNNRTVSSNLVVGGVLTVGPNGLTGNNNALVIQGTNSGDASQGAQIQINNVNATNGKKYLRVDAGGALQVLNNAYGALLFSLSEAGQAYFGGPITVAASAPTASACGTSPTVDSGSSSNFGKVTLGTGSPTACTLTFVTAFPTNAYCSVTPVSNYTGTYYISAQSRTAFTITLGTGTSNAVFQYTCGGN
jgi:hypothetical protein